MLEDVCAGLHHAHGLGIVHRDIKPANVMRLDSGLVKVLDFGVARGGAGPVTRAGDVVGTLNYMSPEQLVGEPVDHRTDVYAVGALAYELFTLRMAFPGSIDTGVLHRILNAGALPIADVIPGIDPDIATIVERAMARDVDARYQHLEAMRDAVATVRVRAPRERRGRRTARRRECGNARRFRPDRLRSSTPVAEEFDGRSSHPLRRVAPDGAGPAARSHEQHVAARRRVRGACRRACCHSGSQATACCGPASRA